MKHFFKKNLPLISFICIPTLFLWHPNSFGILGIQPYWPLMWLLPWSMSYGSINGVIAGLFLGLILDSISFGISFTQIPGLVLCGLWFGKININTKSEFVGHFRYGLICSIGSLGCGIFFLLQIMLKNSFENNFLFFASGIRNILTQVFLTALFAPFICSKLMKLFKNFQ